MLWTGIIERSHRDSATRDPGSDRSRVPHPESRYYQRSHAPDPRVGVAPAGGAADLGRLCVRRVAGRRRRDAPRRRRAATRTPCASRGTRPSTVARRHGDGRVVLAADTVVVAGGEVLGKPRDAHDAERMLRRLSDAVHQVLTRPSSCARRAASRPKSVTTRVHFRRLTDAEIAWYVASGEPDGKAGAYAIQGRGARFIDWIEGSWSNVVGLPIATVYRLLNADPDRSRTPPPARSCRARAD